MQGFFYGTRFDHREEDFKFLTSLNASFKFNHHVQKKPVVFNHRLHFTPLSIFAQNDLSLRLFIAKTMAKRTDKVVLKVTVFNQKRTKLTGVKVNVPIPDGSIYVTDNDPNAYDPTAGMWYIGTIPATTDSVSMTLTIEIKTEGVVYCYAEIDTWR